MAENNEEPTTAAVLREVPLVKENALLILDLRLDAVDNIRQLNLRGDHLAHGSTDEDLHASTEAQDESERPFLVVLPKRALTKICMPPRRHRMRASGHPWSSCPKES